MQTPKDTVMLVAGLGGRLKPFIGRLRPCLAARQVICDAWCKHATSNASQLSMG